jgi:hypothetical protein
MTSPSGLPQIQKFRGGSGINDPSYNPLTGISDFPDRVEIASFANTAHSHIAQKNRDTR